MTEVLSRLLFTLSRHERGQTMVEYALVIALISIATIGAMQLMTGRMIDVFNTLSATL